MKGLIAIFVVALAAGAFAEVKCPPEQEYDWSVELLLPHSDCSKYYQCTHGKPVVRFCPAGLWFNAATWACDYPDNVVCESQEPDNSATPEPEEEVDVEEIQVAPESSAEQEIDLEEIQVTPESPPAQEIDVKEIQVTPESPPEQETSTGKEIKFFPNGCPENSDIRWRLPAKRSCRRYCECINGKKIQKWCPLDRQYFNRELQVCQRPSESGCRN